MSKKIPMLDSLVNVRVVHDGVSQWKSMPEQYLLDGKRYFAMAVCYKLPVNEPTDPKGTTYIRVTIKPDTEVHLGRAAVCEFIENNLGANLVDFCMEQGFLELIGGTESDAKTH